MDIGAYGSEGDASVFGTSVMGKKIINNTLELPQDAAIGSQELPFYFVANDAFPLTKRIMKPYKP